MYLLFIFWAAGSGGAVSSQLAWGQWFLTPLRQNLEFAFMSDSGSYTSPAAFLPGDVSALALWLWIGLGGSCQKQGPHLPKPKMADDFLPTPLTQDLSASKVLLCYA